MADRVRRLPVRRLPVRQGSVRTGWVLGVVLLVAAMVPVAAQDFGFVAENSTGFASRTTGLVGQVDPETRTKVGAWFSLEREALRVGGQVSVRTRDIIDPEAYQFDVDFLNLELRAADLIGDGSSLATSFGRFLLAESTRMVLSHSVDGALVTLTLPRVELALGVGTTALLFKYSNGILPTGADITDLLDVATLLAPARLVTHAYFLARELFLSADLRVNVVWQQDLRADSPEVDTMSAVYGGLDIAGPIIGPFFYQLYGYAAGMFRKPVDQTTPAVGSLGVLAGGRIRVMPRIDLSPVITVDGFFTTGDDAAGGVAAFAPINHPSTGVVVSPLLGNLSSFGASASIRPVDWLQVGLTSTTLFRSGPGAVYGMLTTETEGPTLLGGELVARMNLRPFSDFGMSMLMGVFLPYSGAGRFIARLEMVLTI